MLDQSAWLFSGKILTLLDVRVCAFVNFHARAPDSCGQKDDRCYPSVMNNKSEKPLIPKLVGCKMSHFAFLLGHNHCGKRQIKGWSAQSEADSKSVTGRGPQRITLSLDTTGSVWMCFGQILDGLDEFGIVLDNSWISLDWVSKKLKQRGHLCSDDFDTAHC